MSLSSNQPPCVCTVSCPSDSHSPRPSHSHSITRSGAREDPCQPRVRAQEAQQARWRQALAAGQEHLRGAQGAPQGETGGVLGGGGSCVVVLCSRTGYNPTQNTPCTQFYSWHISFAAEPPLSFTCRGSRSILKAPDLLCQFHRPETVCLTSPLPCCRPAVCVSLQAKLATLMEADDE